MPDRRNAAWEPRWPGPWFLACPGVGQTRVVQLTLKMLIIYMFHQRGCGLRGWRMGPGGVGRGGLLGRRMEMASNIGWKPLRLDLEGWVALPRVGLFRLQRGCVMREELGVWRGE